MVLGDVDVAAVALDQLVKELSTNELTQDEPVRDPGGPARTDRRRRATGHAPTGKGNPDRFCSPVEAGWPTPGVPRVA
ncbi:hypothetical protein L083_0533 [Actinoplanes sp. N902-109]|nr:hypothetical protein L083_0533 [Actinoplanes sp. N902-109]